MNDHRPLDTVPEPVRLRVEDYLLLDESGAFDAYAKTELIDGRIVFMNAQHRPHALAKMKLYDALRDRLQAMESPWVPLVEVGLQLLAENLVEPDLVLTSEPRGEGFIPLHSVALVIEVADTSLKYDLGEKAALYAAHDIPEYWVAGIEGRVIHQMWRPANGSYGESRQLRFGDPVQSATISGLRVETAGI